VGEEANFEQIIDLMEMKIISFQGEMGKEVVKEDLPENLKHKAEEWRNKMIEKIVSEDELIMENI